MDLTVYIAKRIHTMNEALPMPVPWWSAME